MDGFGAFGPPTSTTRPVPAGYNGRANADHPPGFYGPPEGLLAVNTFAPADRLTGLDYAPLNARLEAYQVGEPQDLRGPVLLAALGLLLLDALVVFVLAGGLAQIMRGKPRRAAAALVLAGLFAALAFGTQALAQDVTQQQRTPAQRGLEILRGGPPQAQSKPETQFAPGMPADQEFAGMPGVNCVSGLLWACGGPPRRISRPRCAGVRCCCATSCASA